MKNDPFSSVFDSGLWTGEVSRLLAFSILGICSVGLIWYTLTAAENIKESFKNSAAVRLELRPGYMDTAPSQKDPH